MKFVTGEQVFVPYDDSEQNQLIIKKIVEVVRQVTDTSPFWIDVTYLGKEYTVRGSEVRRNVTS